MERAIGPHDSVVRAVGSEPGENEILRAKYLDWCSARVAERFLRLTPDEIYELAQQASQGEAAASRDDAHAAAFPPNEMTDLEPSPTFRAIVARVTEALTTELSLPAFEQWVAAYRESPSRYDEELLGLWREHLK